MVNCFASIINRQSDPIETVSSQDSGTFDIANIEVDVRDFGFIKKV